MLKESSSNIIQNHAEISELKHDYGIKEKTEPLKRPEIKKPESSTSLKKLQEIVLQPKLNKIKNKVHQEVQDIADKAIKENYDAKVAVILQLNDANNIPKVSDIISSQGGNVKAEFSLGAAITADIPSTKIQTLAKESSVESIWPDREYEMLLDDSHDIIDTQAAWNLNYTGKDVKIAILDTGIDENHEMFNGRVIASKAFTGENHADDRQGHGTHVAGIAAGNGKYKGVAPDALLYNAKVLSDAGKGTTSSIIAGISWAVDPDNNVSTNDGANIISISIGGAYNDQDGPIINALKQAIAHGVVVVIASGNCGNGCNGFYGVTTPGDMQEAITVGAVDNSLLRASFSSYQDFGTYSKPDLVAPGVNILSSVVGSYSAKSGTSMAAPFVAGTAALLLEANHSLTNNDVKTLITANVYDILEPGKDVETGYGILNLASLFNIEKYDQTDNITYKNKTNNITVNYTIPCLTSAFNKTLEAFKLAGYTSTNSISEFDKNTCITILRNNASAIRMQQKIFDSQFGIYEYIKNNYNLLYYYNISSLDGFNIIFQNSTALWTNGNILITAEYPDINDIKLLLQTNPSDFQSNYFEFISKLNELQQQRIYELLNKYQSSKNISVSSSDINSSQESFSLPIEYVNYISKISQLKPNTILDDKKNSSEISSNYTSLVWDTCSTGSTFNYWTQVLNYHSDGANDNDWFKTKVNNTDPYLIYLDPDGNDDFDLEAYRDCNGAQLGASSLGGNQTDTIFFSGYNNIVAIDVKTFNLIENNRYTLQLGPSLGNKDLCAFLHNYGVTCSRNQYDCDSDSECDSGLKCKCIGNGCNSDSSSGYYDGCCNSDEVWDGNSCEANCQDNDGDGYYKQSGCGTSVDCNDADNQVFPGNVEVCDGKDNDCDGQIDEGVRNICGTCGIVPVEICNGIDDDCDGSIDEGFDLTKDNLNCGSCGNACPANSNCVNSVCKKIQLSNITIQSIFNIIPSSTTPNQAVSFTARLKNTGNSPESIFVEGAVVPESWAGVLYPAEYNAETVRDNPFPVCPQNKYYASKIVELNGNEINDVVFNVIAPNISSVDACDTHTPKRSAWDTRFRVITGTYLNINGGSYESFASTPYTINIPQCNFPYGTSADCSCLNSVYKCPANYTCSSTGQCRAIICNSNTNCLNNEKCVNNVCMKSCENECSTLGSYFCDNIAIVQCGQFDDDYCNDKKVVNVCREGLSCVNGRDSCQSVNTKLQIEDAPKDVTVIKQPGDWLSIKLNNNLAEDITFEYDSTAFTGNCQNGIIRVANKKECLFLVGTKKGSYDFKIVNGEKKTVEVIDAPRALIVTDKKKLGERFSVNADNSEIKNLLEKAYRTASDKKGIVYDLNEYRLDVGNNPWNSFNDYKETPTTSNITNDYPLAIAEFIKEKCGNCKDTIILGDDYVVPYYRSNIPMDEVIGDRVDSIYTDTAYVQRTSKPFSEFDELFKNHDGTYEGKDVKFILPAAISSEYRYEIERLKRAFRARSLNPDITEISANDVYCNNANFFNTLKGNTLIIIGTEENNRAFNCFPFAADSLYRDTATIEKNVWDGKEYSVLINTENATVLQNFVSVIASGAYEKLTSENLYFIEIGIDVASWVSIACTPFGIPCDIVPDALDSGFRCGIMQEAVLCTVSASFLALPYIPAAPVKKLVKSFIKEGGEIASKFIAKHRGGGILVLEKLFRKYSMTTVVKIVDVMQSFKHISFKIADGVGTILKHGTKANADAVIREYDEEVAKKVFESASKNMDEAVEKAARGEFSNKGIFIGDFNSVFANRRSYGQNTGRIFVADPNFIDKTRLTDKNYVKLIEGQLGLPGGSISNSKNIAYVEIPDIKLKFIDKGIPQSTHSSMEVFLPGKGATVGGIPERIIQPQDISNYIEEVIVK